MYWIYILIIVAGYFFLVFVGTRLFVPFMGFRQYRPPENLSSEIRAQINQWESESSDAYAYLQKAYLYVQEHWHAGRMDTFFRFPLAFRKDINRLWRTPGYAHCHTSNFILYTLLANSKFFSAGDIRIRHTFLNCMIHQYLLVRAGGKWIAADPAVVFRKQPLGRHSWFFG